MKKRGEKKKKRGKWDGWTKIRFYGWSTLGFWQERGERKEREQRSKKGDVSHHLWQV